jgi:hypothetical protein
VLEALRTLVRSVRTLAIIAWRRRPATRLIIWFGATAAIGVLAYVASGLWTPLVCVFIVLLAGSLAQAQVRPGAILLLGLGSLVAALVASILSASKISEGASNLALVAIVIACIVRWISSRAQRYAPRTDRTPSGARELT